MFLLGNRLVLRAELPDHVHQLRGINDLRFIWSKNNDNNDWTGTLGNNALKVKFGDCHVPYNYETWIIVAACG